MNDTTETMVEEPSTVDNSVEREIPSFKDLISPQFKEVKALQNFETVDSIVKSYLSAQEMLGKRVRDLSAEDISVIDKKFGKPESKDGYSFKTEDDFLDKAFEAGLTDAQAARYHKIEMSKQEQKAKEQQQAAELLKEKVEKELDAEFGAHLEARMELANKVAKDHLGEDYVLPLDAKLIKAFANMGKKLYDHESVGTNQVGQFGLSASEAREELNMLRNDPAHKKAMMSYNKATREAALAKEDYFLQKIYKG